MDLKPKLQVSALRNGTVIDHIPSDKMMSIMSLLHLENVTSPVTIGFNLQSKKMDHKGIVKIADRFFTDEEINQISVISQGVTLCIIRDYKVVEKRHLQMPDSLHNIVRCSNPICITNNEPMSTLFHVTDKKEGTIRCHYCNREQQLDKAKLV